jgi:catechol 2,3-dioxygenase-like lactoylglutathione lyase family enzyme
MAHVDPRGGQQRRPHGAAPFGARLDAAVRLRRGPSWTMTCMDVLSSRVLLRPSDLDRSVRFYRDVLGLAVAREFGPPDHPGTVFFLGNGLLEVSGRSQEPPRGMALWIQVRDVADEHGRLVAAGVRVVRAPQLEPWGLVELWVEDPDGVSIVLVEVPEGHPLRRDQR